MLICANHWLFYTTTIMKHLLNVNCVTATDHIVLHVLCYLILTILHLGGGSLIL